MRKKVVELDGQTFTISPLNLQQCEEFIKPAAAGVTPRQRTIELIITSLNNAAPPEPWTEENLRPELDLIVVGWLQKEILSFSGLATADETGRTPGESTAASRNGSETLAAVS